MTRVKRGVLKHKKRKKILKLAKGYRGPKSKNYRIAKTQVLRSMKYAYRDRKRRKRDFRRLWIVRINAAVRESGLSYSKFIHGLRLAEIDINRKILSEMALNDPKSFSELVNIAREKIST